MVSLEQDTRNLTGTVGLASDLLDDSDLAQHWISLSETLAPLVPPS